MRDALGIGVYAALRGRGGQVLAPLRGAFTAFVGPSDRRRWPSVASCVFRPRPCGRILASALRSALRIVRPVPAAPR